MPLSAFIGAGSLSRDHRHPQTQGKPLPRTWYRPLQLLCSLLARPFVGGLRSRVHELESELAVLNSCSIVSSTDASGRITHVNELFCYLSGYYARGADRPQSQRDQLGAPSPQVLHGHVPEHRHRSSLARRDLQPGQERRSLLARHHHHPDHRQLGSRDPLHLGVRRYHRPQAS